MIRKIISSLKYKVRKKLNVFQNEFRIARSKNSIKALKNIHYGKRCFIVGNGPSLKVEDLEKIQNEICFGTHRIYQIFDKTYWRPMYYCAQDYKLIQESYKEISNINVKRKFIATIAERKYNKIKNAVYIKFFSKPFYPQLPEFSDDVSWGIYEGYTVTYMCLQLALYMGFKEIYLLGVDHNYSTVMMPDGSIKRNEEIKDHFSETDMLTNTPQLFKSTLAYEKAKQCAEKKGVKIYNASRGGKLDVYERINFKDLIE